MSSLFPMEVFRQDARQELYTSAALKVMAGRRTLNVATFVASKKLCRTVTMTANT